MMSWLTETIVQIRPRWAVMLQAVFFMWLGALLHRVHGGRR